MARQLGDDEAKELRDTFLVLNSSGSGLLTSEEVKLGLLGAGFEQGTEELERILCEIDANGLGGIEYSEFLAATMDRKFYVREGLCRAAFRVFDLDGDGYIAQW